jgi:hypothetical protein
MRRVQTGRYARVPLIYRATALTACTHRTRGEAPAQREPRGGAPPSASAWHRQRQKWATDGRCPAKSPASRRARFLTWRRARRQAPRAAPRRNLRLSGAAHQWAQRRTDTSVRRARMPRSRQGRQHISTTCECGKQSLAETALQECRVAGVTGPMTRRCAQVTGWCRAASSRAPCLSPRRELPRWPCSGPCPAGRRAPLTNEAVGAVPGPAARLAA